MKSFETLNAGKPYAEQVKPFNFLLTAQVISFGQPEAVDPKSFVPLQKVTRSNRILLVDDFEPCRQFVVEWLGKRPELQVVGEASDGLEALQKAAELRPDLILLDIRLPSLNGTKLLGKCGVFSQNPKSSS